MKNQEGFVKILEGCNCALSDVESSLRDNLKVIKETVKEFDSQKETKRNIEDFSEEERGLIIILNNKLESVYSLIEEYDNL